MMPSIRHSIIRLYGRSPISIRAQVCYFGCSDRGLLFNSSNHLISPFRTQLYQITEVVIHLKSFAMFFNIDCIMFLSLQDLLVTQIVKLKCCTLSQEYLFRRMAMPKEFATSPNCRQAIRFGLSSPIVQTQTHFN